jgi:hypothetical protein
MRLTFTKRNGKYDDLLIEREGREPDIFSNPKQRIIPHDMVHYGVESVLSHRGFLSLVAQGQGAVFATVGGESEDAVERLVEAFQAEMWGGRVPADELLDAYRLGCEARGHAAVPVSAEDVEEVRQRLDALTELWSAVPVGESLVLEI